MLAFENKATPADAAVALNQILNCLFPMAVKIYDMQKLAFDMYEELEKLGADLGSIDQPTFSPRMPEVFVCGIRVCGTAWFVDGLELGFNKTRLLGVSCLASVPDHAVDDDTG
jgi:hypothetical protein